MRNDLAARIAALNEKVDKDLASAQDVIDESKRMQAFCREVGQSSSAKEARRRLDNINKTL